MHRNSLIGCCRCDGASSSTASYLDDGELVSEGRAANHRLTPWAAPEADLVTPAPWTNGKNAAAAQKKSECMIEDVEIWETGLRTWYCHEALIFILYSTKGMLKYMVISPTAKVWKWGEGAFISPAYCAAEESHDALVDNLYWNTGPSASGVLMKRVLIEKKSIPQRDSTPWSCLYDRHLMSPRWRLESWRNIVITITESCFAYYRSNEEQPSRTKSHIEECQ